jgi:hypothetical protein
MNFTEAEAVKVWAASGEAAPTWVATSAALIVPTWTAAAVATVPHQMTAISVSPTRDAAAVAATGPTQTTSTWATVLTVLTVHLAKSCVGCTIAFYPSASWYPLETLLMLIKKRSKYQDYLTLPPESLEDGKVAGIIKLLGQHQHSILYNIELKFKTVNTLTLHIAEVVSFLVHDDVVAGVSLPDETDRNCTSCLLHRVPDSDQGVYPESGDEGNDVNLSQENDCIWIIADSDNFTWHRMEQGDFVFMDQDTEDDIPNLHNDEMTQVLTLEWIEEGTLPEPYEKKEEAPGCLRKVQEKIFFSLVVYFVSTLPLIFWKVCGSLCTTSALRIATSITRAPREWRISGTRARASLTITLVKKKAIAWYLHLNPSWMQRNTLGRSATLTLSFMCASIMSTTRC